MRAGCPARLFLPSEALTQPLPAAPRPPQVDIGKDGKVTFTDKNGGKADVKDKDIVAGQAIVHTIDEVLLPVELSSLMADMPNMPVAPTPAPVEPTSSARGLVASAAALAATVLAAAFLA